MANVIRIKRRAAGGAAGAPTTLSAAELAYNEQDDTLYYGKGDVSGTASTVIAIAGSGAYTPVAHVGSGGAAHATAVAGGAAGFLTGADKTKLDATTGTNSGDETLATIKTKLGITTLSGSNTGDQVIPVAASTTPAALGTSAVGVSTTFARSDHVHQIITTITGNAATATVLATPRTINGVSFDGSANITINAVDSTARVASSLLGAVNGVATLDSNGTVPAGQLPSYVDDVLEYANLASFPATGSTGKIYVALDTNKTYRWSGTAYVYITSGAVDSVGGNTGVVTNAQISAAATAGYGFTPYSNANPAGYTTNVGTVTSVTATAPIASTGGTAPVISIAAATTSAAGSMSAADKTKLDGVATGANNYSLPTAAAGTLGGIKVGTGLTIDGTGILAAVGGSGAPMLISANTTAVSGNSYVFTAALTLTLPATPPTGSVVMFSNPSGFACTVARNAQLLMSLSEDLVLDTSFSSASVVFIGGTVGWQLADISSTAVIPTAWTSITSKPTTVAGYGITDAVGVTNLAQGTRTTTTVPITSSTGTSATLDVASTTLAGVMSSADKTKLDAITGTHTGSNTGDNAVNTLYSGLVTNATHTGDVTGSAALTIANSAVTYAKMQNVSATSRVLGRITAAAGVVEELTGANLATIIGITNTAANVNSVNGNTGAVTAAQISAAATTGYGFTPYSNANPSGYTTNVGTVTSVAALTLGTTGTDVSSSVATGTVTPVITLNIPTASAANRGALSAADWTTFNGKQAALGFTPYNSTNPSGYTSNVGTVTSVAALTLGTTGTDVSSSVATGTVTPVITLNIPTASAANRGALSAADWSTFNGKQAALGFTPYNSTNPSGYTSNVGTVTSVGGTGSVSGLTLSGSVTTSGNLTLGGAISTLPSGVSAPGILGSTSNAVTAAGTTQGTATALTSDVNIITTAAAGTGVVVPGATSGKYAVVVNRGANALNVYPSTGHAFDGLAANTAISLPVNGFIEMFGSSTTQWHTTYQAIVQSAYVVGNIDGGTF